MLVPCRGGLLSIDGARDLGPSGGPHGGHGARAGIDGNRRTGAQAGGEWPWAYEVDLLQDVRVGRVVVAFGQGYPTVAEVHLPADRLRWTKVLALSNHDGSTIDRTLTPTPARYVRVIARKPDGPGQKGMQMQITELQVYAVRRGR